MVQAGIRVAVWSLIPSTGLFHLFLGRWMQMTVGSKIGTYLAATKLEASRFLR
jgi:hypothetical protein